MASYDAIVIGTGGIGSAALYHLARRGLRVLGLDRFPAAHDRGSSHGQTRVIRQAYFEHPDYVPLLKRGYALWRELETLAGVHLFHQVGLLQVGPPEGAVVRGVLASAKQHQLQVELLSPAEAQTRFPGFRVAEHMVGVFELEAGYLLVEDCVRAHLKAATRSGAVHRTDVTVQGWTSTSGGVTVTTDRGVFHAAKLVVTGGAWSANLLRDLRLPLEVRRKHAYWFAPCEPVYEQSQGCPTFLYDLPEGVFYGFPSMAPYGLKAAEHSGGKVTDDPLADPRAFDEADCARLTDFLAKCLPGVSPQVAHHSVCFYTMTPDEHFVVGLHPQHENVAFVAGLSGHGYKFASVLGEVLADLTVQGRTAHPICFLNPTRFGPLLG